MILGVPSVLLWLYLSVSLFKGEACPPWAKAAAVVLLALACGKYFVYELIGGAFFAPDLPKPVLLVLEAFYAGMVILFCLLLLKDAALLLLAVLRRFGAEVPAPSLGILKACLALISLAMGAWGVMQSVRVPEVRTTEVRLKRLPPALDGLSIIQLTDLHIGNLLDAGWLRQVVECANAARPDLILLTGDYADGLVDRLGDALAPLGDLRARLGVLGVTGNHEYYWGSRQWLDVLDRLGVDVLRNGHRLIPAGDAAIVVAGVPDRVESRFGGTGPDIAAALEGAPRDAVRILMEHQPRNAVDRAAHADLQLSGHTHGGMIILLHPLIAAFNRGFVRGMYDVDGMKLHVAPGAGLWAGFSCRVGVPSEISRLVLRSGADG